MAGYPHNWCVFIDESGAFDNPEVVSVTGLLMRWPLPGLRRVEAGALFQQHLSHVPWPVHAAHLNHDVSQVVWHAAVPNLNSHLPDERLEVLKESVECLFKHAKTRFKRAIQDSRLRQGRFDIGDAWHLRKVLGTQTCHLPKLTAFARQDLENYQKILQHVSLLGTEYAQGGLCGASIVCGGETFLGDARPADRGAQATARIRYLTLFSTLLTRAAAVVGRLEGEHQIRVVSLVFGGIAKMELDAAINAVTCPPTVALLPLGAYHWDAYDLDARLVLADFLANRVNGVLKSHRRKLNQFVESVVATTGLPISSGKPQRAHLAAGPTAATWITPMTADDIRAAAAAASFPWAIDQAIQWL